MSIKDQLGMECFVHEAGHLVVGHALGLRGQIVEFTGAHPEPLKAWFSLSDQSVAAKRSLAGLLAHVILMPQTLEKRLVEAYNHSIIFTPEHPSWEALSADEKQFLSGAETDMRLAWEYASNALGNHDERKIVAFLRRVESAVREIILAERNLILCVAEAMKEWLMSKDPLKDAMFSTNTAIAACSSQSEKPCCTNKPA